MKIFGENGYITEVKPHSDAEAQGLKSGDQILSIDGIRPTRANTWIFYLSFTINLFRGHLSNWSFKVPASRPDHWK